MKWFRAVMRCCEAPLDLVPGAPGDDAGNDVEGKDALGAVPVVVDVEGDPHPQEGARGRLLAAQQLPVGEALDAIDERAGLGPGRAVRVEQLVVEPVGRVPLERHSSASPRLRLRPPPCRPRDESRVPRTQEFRASETPNAPARPSSPAAPPGAQRTLPGVCTVLRRRLPVRRSRASAQPHARRPRGSGRRAGCRRTSSSPRGRRTRRPGPRSRATRTRRSRARSTPWGRRR